MLKVLHEKWNQSPENLYQSGLLEPHHRTRERFMALYRITCNESATQVALSINRATHSVWKWVKDYNESGPEALQYKRTGGHPPFARSSRRL